MPIDYESAARVLESEFETVQNAQLAGHEIHFSNQELIPDFHLIFRSSTQAFREVLIGCVLARMEDGHIDASRPYMNLGENAYNGRTLDERVVNPFLQKHRIPCSKGPFLSMFRRSVGFDKSTRKGVRDTTGFDALLRLVSFINDSEGPILEKFLRYLLFQFYRLREDGIVQLSKLQRISLSQYESLISGLLTVPSGGRIPLILTIAMFQAIKQAFNLSWVVDFQGINEADSATGAGGDITISDPDNGTILLAVEVTERPVNSNRVLTTFNTKIAPNNISDYLFITLASIPDAQAKAQADQYFAQGADVNFIEIKAWIIMLLATIGNTGRNAFNSWLTSAFDAADISKALKVAWNNQIERLTTINPATR